MAGSVGALSATTRDSRMAPSPSQGVKVTLPVVVTLASMLPQSAGFLVLMYFLSGRIMTFAPMLTSRLGQSAAAVLRPRS